MANTRKLLEAKQEHDRQPQPWQALDPTQGHSPSAGFQPHETDGKAEELHQAESGLKAVQGAISTHDRHAQGKNDKR